jgi:gluconokinase
MIVIVMGVTGTGKSTIAKALAERTGWTFAEGDDYHSAANVAKMKSGVPLNDSDRAPWLAALHDVLLGWQADGKSGVMTCSALKQSYRETLGDGMEPAYFRFILLEVPKQVLIDRLRHRPGHFMNPALLDSQLATLEVTADLVRVNADQPPANTVDDILKQLGAQAAELTTTAEKKGT